jgi:cytoskeletal protein CcmA (bactofilin family)
MKKGSYRHPAETTRREALLALLGTALLPACGGGTDVAGISSGGTGSFTSGTITGLGSVIVNGIRYEYDDTVSVTIDGAPSNAAALQLGMVVRIQGSAITAPATAGALATATATSIAYGSEWKGRAANVDLGKGIFTLLGQTVRVPGTTVFAQGKFDGSLNGQYVEVYGYVNANDGSLQASRIEVESGAPDRYRLSGVISGWTETTFLLGTALINHASADKPANLQNGQLVRVKLRTTQQGGAWVATEVQLDNYSNELEDDDEAEIEGAITSFSSSAAFSVNGIAVDASRIRPPTGLGLGVRVEVKGAISSGVVIATEIDIKTDEDIEAQEYEFHGTISGLTANTFVVRGYTLRYNGSTRFEPSGTTLTDGLLVEVKAQLQSNGELLATQVEVEH